MKGAGNINGKKQRDRIGVILYVLYVLLLIASVLIVGKIIYIQIGFRPDTKISTALKPASTRRSIMPARGNILDCNGKLLAISRPTYKISMDCTVRKAEFAADRDGEKKEKAWLDSARKLSVCLAKEFPGKSADSYYKTICQGRKEGKRYLTLAKSVDHNAYNRICDYPLFNAGRNKGGLIAEREEVRTYPYGSLARRTIGFVRNNNTEITNTHIGIEGKFDYELHGKTGTEWLRTTDKGRKVRDFDSTFVNCVDGNDIRTTINIDYQEIADKALRELVEPEDDLEAATLVLMETSTGAIRAMVNLTRDGKSFEEISNIAVGRKGEPGSVFKTVTLMQLLSDGHLKNLDQKIPTRHGQIAGTSLKPDRHIVDYEREHHCSQISVLDGFKMSSNYVFATVAINAYGQKPGKFIDNIHSYKLGEAFDFDLDGLATPSIPSPDSRYWTNSDLGNMAYGYSTGLTPLHVLTYYNAIANKGRMMKPYLVEDIESAGVIKTKRGPSVLNSAICSKAVADTITRALKAVVEDGTGRRLKGCDVAGKTGTSFGTFPGGKYKDAQDRCKYQGTFAGFFPVDDPQYSIICEIYSAPTRKSFQGGGIPAKAVRKVVETLYKIDPKFRPAVLKGGDSITAADYRKSVAGTDDASMAEIDKYEDTADVL